MDFKTTDATSEGKKVKPLTNTLLVIGKLGLGALIGVTNINGGMHLLTMNQSQAIKSQTLRVRESPEPKLMLLGEPKSKNIMTRKRVIMPRSLTPIGEQGEGIGIFTK